jgi:predicted acylesterase/phospholipase RssA
MLEVDVVLSGGASNCVGLAAALYRLSKRVKIRRIGGTSAGGLCATAFAFGLTEQETKKLLSFYLEKDRLLDGNIFNIPNTFGFCSGNVLAKAIESIVGKKSKIKNADIPMFVVVTDMYQSKPTVISSSTHPDACIIDAATASASLIPVFCARPIEGLNTGNRLYFDGGFAKNFAMDAFDDVPERPTIGLRVKNENFIEPVRQLEFLKAAKAIARTMLYSSDNAYVSSKHSSRIIEVVGGDGLDFSIDKEEFQRRWSLGQKAVDSYVQF